MLDTLSLIHILNALRSRGLKVAVASSSAAPDLSLIHIFSYTHLDVYKRQVVYCAKNIGGATMNIKLTLGERLKDLRVERNLKLETLAEQTRCV